MLVTNLITTLHFFNQLTLADGSLRQQAVAWSWLVVYVALPPAVAIVAVAHERRAGRRAWQVVEPLALATCVSFAIVAASLAVLGIWLMVAPHALAERWPWKLPPLPASIVGTWLLTLATAFGWAVVERDWARVRIIILPIGLTLVLNLIVLVRFADTLTGSTASIAIYVCSVAACFAALAGAALRERAAHLPGRVEATGAFVAH